MKTCHGKAGLRHTSNAATRLS